jgi:hypothetical protein
LAERYRALDQLTLSGNHFIVQGIPEENMLREIRFGREDHPLRYINF